MTKTEKRESKAFLSKAKLDPLRKDRLVVLADTQAPFHLPQAIALACAYIADYKPAALVLNGDIPDFFTISKFKRLGDSTTKVVDEIKITLAEVLEPIIQTARKANPAVKIWWVGGNHEYRLARFIAYKAPELEGLRGTTIPDAFGLDKLGVKYIDSVAGNGILRLSKTLTCMHGTRHGINPAKQTYDDWGASAIIGHAHKEATYRKKWGCGDRDDVIVASGCLCADPSFADMNQYTRGFVSGWYQPDGEEFFLQHIRISGKDHTQMYVPDGEYNAKYFKQAHFEDGRGVWKVTRS